jgi:hypothetical protein
MFDSYRIRRSCQKLAAYLKGYYAILRKEIIFRDIPTYYTQQILQKFVTIQVSSLQSNWIIIQIVYLEKLQIHYSCNLQF